MPTPSERFVAALETHAAEFGIRLDDQAVAQLDRYYGVLLKWNERLHLVAPCTPEEFAVRHVLESLMLLPYLRPNAKVVDIGSGGGLPMIPCLIAANNLQATLVESSQRKAVFLREAVRPISEATTVIAQPFENLPTPDADFVTCRALERMSQKLPVLVCWPPAPSTLLFFGGSGLREQIEVTGLRFTAVRIPRSERRFLYVIDRPTG